MFRNALVHGAIPKPLPSDWGEAASHSWIAEDRTIRSFHANVRPTLMLTQALMLRQVDAEEPIQAWLDEPRSAATVLVQMHCSSETGDQIDLPLGRETLVEAD